MISRGETTPPAGEPAAGGELMGLYIQVLDLLVAGAPTREVLETVTLTLERSMPGALCAVLLLDKTENVLRFGAGPSLPEEWCRFIDPLPVGPMVGSCGSAAYFGRRVIVADVTADERWVNFRGVAVRLGLRACWSTPIVGRQNEILGTFAVYHGRPHAPTDRELGLIDRCTHLAAVAIDHDRLFGALAESEDRFRRAFESNAVGMALLDLEGQFVRVNPALCEMLGVGEAELLGRELQSCVHPNGINDTDAALRQVRDATSQSVQLEQQCLRRDGAIVPVTFTAAALHGAGGSPVGIWVYALDMTHRHAAEEQRRRAIEAEVAQRTAESASRAKSQFLSAMSHELRTPLTALLGFAALLDTLEPERRRAAIGRIQEAASHVVSILDDVLDIAKIEASAATMQLEPVALDFLVRETLELVSPLAAERDISLCLAPRRGRVLVHVDPRRVRQVLLNLITNAIKYNRPGGEVWVEIERRQPEGVVRVRDSGIGIDPSLLWRLFKPFDRLGAERTGTPGSGLGLSLSRALALAMKGDIKVDSVVGIGTTVELTLPLARRSPTGARSQSNPEAVANLTTRKDIRGIVLHVEDDPVCGELIAETLRRRPSVHLVTCTTGAEGLVAARKLQPDLILLDLDLPDMSGEEFVSELVHPEFLFAPPIAIVSGRSAAGPVSLPTFRKPIAVAELLQHIDERLISRQLS